MPKRPPTLWLRKCKKDIRRSRKKSGSKDTRDPLKLCAWIWHHSMKPSTKKRILQEYEASAHVPLEDANVGNRVDGVEVRACSSNVYKRGVGWIPVKDYYLYVQQVSTRPFDFWTVRAKTKNKPDIAHQISKSVETLYRAAIPSTATFRTDVKRQVPDDDERKVYLRKLNQQIRKAVYEIDSKKRRWIRRDIRRPGRYRRLMEEHGYAEKGKSIPLWIKEAGCKDPVKTYKKLFGKKPKNPRLFQRQSCLPRTFHTLPSGRRGPGKKARTEDFEARGGKRVRRTKHKMPVEVQVETRYKQLKVPNIDLYKRTIEGYTITAKIGNEVKRIRIKGPHARANEIAQEFKDAMNEEQLIKVYNKYAGDQS